MNIIFIIASITDKLDGYIARSRNEITTFGKFLDPIADKILVLAAMLILVEMAKTTSMDTNYSIIQRIYSFRLQTSSSRKGGEVIAASIWGKLKTVTQMIAIILAFIDTSYYGAFIDGGLIGYNYIINLVMTAIMTISVIATIFPGYDYVKNGKDLFKIVLCNLVKNKL